MNMVYQLCWEQKRSWTQNSFLCLECCGRLAFLAATLAVDLPIIVGCALHHRDQSGHATETGSSKQIELQIERKGVMLYVALSD